MERLQWLAVAVLTLGVAGLLPADNAKILEQTLFSADEQSFRYSEGSIVELEEDRELLMAVSVFGEGGHDNSPGRIMAWPSHDGGMTWVDDERFVIQGNIGKQNVLSPAFLRISPTEILFFFLVTNSIQDCGPWMRRSTNNGQTWSQPERLPYDGYGGHANDHAVLLKSGRILLPCWVSRDSLGSAYAYCFYSDDREEPGRSPTSSRSTGPARDARPLPPPKSPP